MYLGHGGILIFSPNVAGDEFILALSERKEFSVLACSSVQKQHYLELGVKSIIDVDITENYSIHLAEKAFSKVYIFEEELGLCCGVIEYTRKWTNGILFVITRKHYPQMIYKALGADFVIRTKSGNVFFLIEKETT